MLKTIYNLCLFKAKPDQIPYSLLLLIVTGVINYCLAFYLIATMTNSISLAFWKGILLPVSTLIFTRIVLQIYDRPQRFIQTLSALFASQTCILMLALVPYALLMTLLPDITVNFYYVVGLSLSGLLLIVSSIWLFLNFASIFESALEITTNASLVITMTLFGIQTMFFQIMY